MIQYLKRLFINKWFKPKIDTPIGYFEIQPLINLEQNKKLQEIENNFITAGIKTEAARWLNEYINAPTLEVNNKKFKAFIPIMRPFISAIMIHDPDTAIYKNADITELVRIEFNKLLEEYEQLNK